MKINKKELIVGNTAYVVTKKYDPNQTKQVYHIDPVEIKKLVVNILRLPYNTGIKNFA